MVDTGFDILSKKTPSELKGKRIAVLCHAPSINSEYEHIIDWLMAENDIELSAIFGPQHGLFGETQDNMIEWEGYKHPEFDIPIYSLYGANRKPTEKNLHNIEAFIIDLQDIGARPYTYIWTMKHCMETCKQMGIPVWVLDRPNPVSELGVEGPVLHRDYYTFVGGAEIPLCHDMTIGEIASWINNYEEIECDLNVIWMEGWQRGMPFRKTGLPWVPPSPNMPTLETGRVYPGTVLTESLNLSEARGTTTPFELFGAPELKSSKLIELLNSSNIKGVAFRSHDYIPTFHKYKDEYCRGVYIHVTDPDKFEPVFTAISIYEAILKTSPGYLSFNEPPYEYEYNLAPFDILIGSNKTREYLLSGGKLRHLQDEWNVEIENFLSDFRRIKQY